MGAAPTAAPITAPTAQGSPPIAVTTAAPAPTSAPQRSRDQLQHEIAALGTQGAGVVGVYVYDLEGERELASLNADTVFSGASMLKAGILVELYATTPSFDDGQRELIRAMIVDSDNGAANELLALLGDGDPGAGALRMSATLADLGLPHTYLRSAYMLDDNQSPGGSSGEPGADNEGAPPFTNADPYVRTTPREIGTLFVWISQCSQGRGPLPKRGGPLLSAERCAEMRDLLAQNADHDRIVAGLPEGTVVAHKSGWVDDGDGDAGIVYAPRGRFVLAVIRSFTPRDPDSEQEYADPAPISAFAQAVYAALNPQNH